MSTVTDIPWNFSFGTVSRDFKVVAGKFVERAGDDPDDEEDGVG
jgi:hypothetical protein